MSIVPLTSRNVPTLSMPRGPPRAIAPVPASSNIVPSLRMFAPAAATNRELGPTFQTPRFVSVAVPKTCTEAWVDQGPATTRSRLSKTSKLLPPTCPNGVPAGISSRPSPPKNWAEVGWSCTIGPPAVAVPARMFKRAALNIVIEGSVRSPNESSTPRFSTRPGVNVTAAPTAALPSMRKQPGPPTVPAVKPYVPTVRSVNRDPFPTPHGSLPAAPISHVPVLDPPTKSVVSLASRRTMPSLSSVSPCMAARAAAWPVTWTRPRLCTREVVPAPNTASLAPINRSRLLVRVRPAPSCRRLPELTPIVPLLMVSICNVTPLPPDNDRVPSIVRVAVPALVIVPNLPSVVPAVRPAPIVTSSFTATLTPPARNSPPRSDVDMRLRVPPLSSNEAAGSTAIDPTVRASRMNWTLPLGKQTLSSAPGDRFSIQLVGASNVASENTPPPSAHVEVHGPAAPTVWPSPGGRAGTPNVTSTATTTTHTTLVRPVMGSILTGVADKLLTAGCPNPTGSTHTAGATCQARRGTGPTRPPCSEYPPPCSSGRIGRRPGAWCRRWSSRPGATSKDHGAWCEDHAPSEPPVRGSNLSPQLRCDRPRVGIASHLGPLRRSDG